MGANDRNNLIINIDEIIQKLISTMNATFAPAPLIHGGCDDYGDLFHYLYKNTDSINDDNTNNILNNRFDSENEGNDINNDEKRTKKEKNLGEKKKKKKKKKKS